VRNELLLEISDLQNQDRSQINLSATSRFVPEIVLQFESCIRKEIRAEEDDVLNYVNAQMPQLLQSLISRYPYLQDQVRDEVIKPTSGMCVYPIQCQCFIFTNAERRFLLARLHMDALSSKSTRGDIKLASRDGSLRYYVRTSKEKNRLSRGAPLITCQKSPLLGYTCEKTIDYC
jgi:hypothetical protein